MKTLTRLLVFAVLFSVAGGAILLATWDPPPPTARVEKVLPDDRFPR